MQVFFKELLLKANNPELAAKIDLVQMEKCEAHTEFRFNFFQEYLSNANKFKSYYGTMPIAVKAVIAVIAVIAVTLPFSRIRPPIPARPVSPSTHIHLHMLLSGRGHRTTRACGPATAGTLDPKAASHNFFSRICSASSTKVGHVCAINTYI